jgi:two-component system response regulator GlrR
MSIQPPRFDPHRREGLDLTVGVSEQMAQVRRAVEIAASNTADLVIVGDAGTGKELIARAIHARAGGKGPFLRVEGDGPPGVIESRLFAPKANGTTLYVNEVADLSSRLQGQLRSALEARSRGSTGHGKSPLYGVRLIAGSSRNLIDSVRHGSFDRALHDRISQLTIVVPALRARREDVPTLIDHFLAVLRAEIGHQVESFSPAAVDALTRRSWPGNVRELYGNVRMTVVLSPARIIEPADLWPQSTEQSESEPYHLSFRELRKRVLQRFERDFVARVLATAGGNVSMAARLAKIDRKHLWRLIQRTGIRLERFDK